MSETSRLFILWTNADPITSEMMVMMYATNSLLQQWWDEVTVIIWGATAKLAAENTGIQTAMQIAKSVGVQFKACKACSDQLGVSGALERQGVEVVYMGTELTRILKENEKLLTI